MVVLSRVESRAGVWSKDAITAALDRPFEWSMFQYLDCDASGLIEEEELREWLHGHGVEVDAALSLWDPNADAVTTFEEFCGLLESNSAVANSMAALKQMRHKMPPITENEVRLTITFSGLSTDLVFGQQSKEKNDLYLSHVAELTTAIKSKFGYCLVLPVATEKKRVFDVHISGRRCGIKELNVELFSFDKFPRRSKDSKSDPFAGTLDLGALMEDVEKFVTTRTLTLDVMAYACPKGEVQPLRVLEGEEVAAAAGALDLVDAQVEVALSLAGERLAVESTRQNGVVRFHVPLVRRVSGQVLLIEFASSVFTAAASVEWRAPALGVGRKLKAVRTSAEAADLVVVLPRVTKLHVQLYATPSNVPLPGGMQVELTSAKGEVLRGEPVRAGDPFVVPEGWWCNFSGLGEGDQAFFQAGPGGAKLPLDVRVRVAGPAEWAHPEAQGYLCVPVHVTIRPGDTTHLHLRVAVPPGAPRIEEDWMAAVLREDTSTLVGHLAAELEEGAEAAVKGKDAGKGHTPRGNAAGLLSPRVPGAQPATGASGRGEPGGAQVECEWESCVLFCSSTFNDFHAERDYLSRYVFPLLRARSLERRVYFSFVDFRWGGVTIEDGRASLTVQRCLEMVDRCRINGRKFFLGILGDRYGWMPWSQGDPDAIKIAGGKYPWILDEPERKGQRANRDLSVTALEVHHGVLRPLRTAKDRESGIAAGALGGEPHGVKGARASVKVARKGGDGGGSVGRGRGTPKASGRASPVLAARGVKADAAEEPAPVAAMMLRHLGKGALAQLPEHERSRFKDLTPAAAKLQQALRRQVQGELPPSHVSQYSAEILQVEDHEGRKSDVFADGGHKFGLKAFKHIWNMLDEQFGPERVIMLPPDPHERESARQRAFQAEVVSSVESLMGVDGGASGGGGGGAGTGELLALKAVGGSSRHQGIHEGLKERVRVWALGRGEEASTCQVIILKGRRGCGRSHVAAAVAGAVECAPAAACAGGKPPRVLPFYFNPGCREKPLVYLSRELQQIAAQRGGKGADGGMGAQAQRTKRGLQTAERTRSLQLVHKGARAALAEDIAEAADALEGAPLVLILDGLHSGTLKMLLEAVNTGGRGRDALRVVIAADVETAGALQGHHKGMSTWEVEELVEEERVHVLQSTLAVFGKHMDQQQLDIVLAKEDAGLPGYLALLAMEMRLYGVFEGVTQRLASLPGTLEGLVEDVMLPRLEAEHGRAAVREVCELLVCADKGLTSWEISRLLPHITQSTLFPLLAALQDTDYLLSPSSTRVDGSICLAGAFVTRIVRARYLTSDVEVALHRHCTAFFANEIDSAGVGAFDRNYARGFEQLPNHATQGGEMDMALRVLGRIEFVVMKVQEFGVDAYIADVDEALAALSPEQRAGGAGGAVEMVERFRAWAEVEYSLLLDAPERAARIAMAAADPAVQAEAQRMEEERLFREHRAAQMSVLGALLDLNPQSVAPASVLRRRGRIFEFQGDKVSSFDLAGCRVATLPPEVGSLSGLRKLVISRHAAGGGRGAAGRRGGGGVEGREDALTDLPAELGECRGLEELYLGGNFLTAPLPKCLALLGNLTHLDLSFNPLGACPHVIGSLLKLQVLNLSGTGIDSMDGVDWALLKDIRTLDVSFNTDLCVVPPSLCLLQQGGVLWKEFLAVACSFPPTALSTFIEEGILVQT